MDRGRLETDGLQQITRMKNYARQALTFEVKDQAETRSTADMLRRAQAIAGKIYCMTCRELAEAHLTFMERHTFSLIIPIHCSRLMPWSARSSTNIVCAHNLKPGSPSSLTTYR